MRPIKRWYLFRFFELLVLGFALAGCWLSVEKIQYERDQKRKTPIEDSEVVPNGEGEGNLAGDDQGVQSDD